jgi:hypothetical protein
MIYYIRFFIICLLTLMSWNVQAATLNDSYQKHDLGPRSTVIEKASLSSGEIQTGVFVDSVNGADANEGSIGKPWQTLKHSVKQLKAGDTLYLRAGTYNESRIRIDISGEPNKPISIMGYPGESTVVDGSLVAYRQNFSTNWELVDKARSLYRSTSLVDPARNYLASIEYQGFKDQIITYYSDAKRDASGYEDLLATSMAVSTQPKYAGPGIVNIDGQLHLRLSSPGEIEGIGALRIPYGKLNLDAVQMSITSEDSIFDISGNHLVFENITIAGAYKAIRMRSGSGQLVFKNINVSSASIGFLADETVDTVLIEQVTIEGAFPSWLAWTDMKGSSKHAKPASHWLMKPSGISGKTIDNLVVRNSQFLNLFDGLVVGGSNINIHNNYFHCVDDMVQLASSASQVWINNNIVMGAGPSHNGKSDSVSPGTKYIHHNIIDSRRKVLWSRDDPAQLINKNQRGVLSTLPFPRHKGQGAGKGDPWKITNNTVVYDSSGYSTDPGYQLWGQVNTTGVMHEVYNNIFWDQGPGMFTRGVLSNQLSQQYDGNVYWANGANEKPTIYKKFVSLSGEKSNLTLPDYIQYSQGQLSRQKSIRLWDQNSVVARPDLDENLIPKQGDNRFPGVPLPQELPGSDKQFVGAAN